MTAAAAAASGVVLDALRAAVERGAGLPNEAYVSPAFHALEQRALFARHWVLAGYLHELPDPGDVAPVDVAGLSLLLAHGHDGVLRAFHNVCRHRGAQLLAEPCSGLKLLTCPNHSWSYDLAGRLKARPHFFGGERHDRAPAEPVADGLAAVRCEVFFDWIFVNIDGGAPPLQTFLAPMIERLAGYDLSCLRFGGRVDFDLRANWKLAYENFIEPYHVFSCHPWLSGFVPMQHRVAPVFDGNLLSCGYEFEKPDPARGMGLPYFRGLPEAKQRRGDWWVLFPTLGVEIFPDQLDLFVVRPTGPETCSEEILVYFVDEGASAPEYAAAREHVLRNWRDLNHEDIGIIERMQRGRHSPGFDGGVLSPYWDAYVGHLSRLVAAAVDDGRES